jgi:hypothetical protein
MKVNIRYTVDLEEVLEEMTGLYHKSLDKLEDNLSIFEHFLEDTFREADVDHIVSALEHSIECYHDHQTRVAEILNILRGFKNIREGNVQPPQPTPEQQAPSE